MAGLNIVSQRDFSSSHLRAIDAFVDRMQYDFYVRAAAIAVEPIESIDLVKLCTKWKMRRRLPFEYASFVSSDFDLESLKSFLKTSVNLTSIGGKPTPAIYFSKLENDVSIAHKYVPGWYKWLNDPEMGSGEAALISQYSNYNILFATYDDTRIQKNINISAGIPDYKSLSDTKDGVHATADSMKDHSVWGVETVAIWNISCLNQIKYYKNIAPWSYSTEPIFDDYASFLPGFSFDL